MILTNIIIVHWLRGQIQRYTSMIFCHISAPHAHIRYQNDPHVSSTVAEVLKINCLVSMATYIRLNNLK